jgi:large subunit GTPase 1
VLEGTYGLRITILPENEGGTGVPTAAEFLNTFSSASQLISLYPFRR